MGQNELVPLSSRVKQVWTYLPFLLAPLGICAVIFYDAYLEGKFSDDPAAKALWLQKWIVVLEMVAPWILAAATAVYWGKAMYTRNLSYVIIGVMTVCLLLRELHWNHMIKVAIFPLLGVCFLWLLLWRDVVDRPLENWRHTLFFVAALATYGLSQMVEKNVIGKRIPILPDFEILHSQYEEIIECCAHVLLLCAAVFGCWRRKIISVK